MKKEGEKGIHKQGSPLDNGPVRAERVYGHEGLIGRRVKVIVIVIINRQSTVIFRQNALGVGPVILRRGRCSGRAGHCGHVSHNLSPSCFFLGSRFCSSTRSRSGGTRITCSRPGPVRQGACDEGRWIGREIGKGRGREEHG